MQDLGYDENDDKVNDDDFNNYQRRARQLLIDSTKHSSLEGNLEGMK